MADRVPLTELDVITRFSLALRTASADRDELIAALRADLAWLEAGAAPTSATVTGAAPGEGSSRTPATATAPRRAAAPRRATKRPQ